MTQRYFYHIDKEKIYTLSEIKDIYNKLVEDRDFTESFDYFLEACKDISLKEIYGNLSVIYIDENNKKNKIDFIKHTEALTVYYCLLNSTNCFDICLIDEIQIILK